MFRIQHIDHIVLRVTNLPRMVDFYCGVLGCAVARRREDLGMVHLRAGGSMIDLVDVAGKLGSAGGAAPGTEGRNLDHLCLRVEPFDESSIREHLQKHDVTVEPAKQRFGAEGEGPSVYLTDPDGNVVELKGPPAAPSPTREPA